MKPDREYNYGICPQCQNLIYRTAPADYAVCEFCYSSNPGHTVLVKLMSVGGLLKWVGEQFFKDHPEVTK